MIHATQRHTADAEIRLWIYEHFVDVGRAPSPIEIAAHFQLTPGEVEHRLRRLQDEADALVLLPGSSYIWMAEPFSAAPTSFTVRSGLLFRSEDDIVAWCEQRHTTPGAVFDVARLWRLATAWYGDRLDSTWRRRTIPERQAILDAVGLTGSFWRLTSS